MLLALAISAIGIDMSPPPNVNVGYTAHIRIVPNLVLCALSIGVAATMRAAILPARRVAATAVVDALCHGTWSGKGAARLRIRGI